MADPAGGDVGSRLTEIEARMEAATKGPWYAVTNDLIGGKAVTNRDVPMSEAENVAVADMTRSDADAAFIAHAREDVPFLLALVRAEREAREQAERERNALAIQIAHEWGWPLSPDAVLTRLTGDRTAALVSFVDEAIIALTAGSPTRKETT